MSKSGNTVLAIRSTREIGNMYAAIDYAKNNIKDNNLLNRIITSFKKMWLYTAILILCIFIASIVFSIIYINNEFKYDSSRIGHVTGDTAWYIQDIKREIVLSDYGFSTADFSNGDEIIIYLDQDNNIIKVEDQKVVTSAEKNFYVVVVDSTIIVLVVIIMIFIIKKTVGRDFFKYYRWYRNGKDINEFRL